MTWTPPPEVRAAGERLRGALPNVQGSQLVSDDLAAVQLPIQPGTRALREYLEARYSVHVGAPRGPSVRKPLRRADGSLRRRDIHEEGRALDLMSEGNRALGERAANWLALNARELGIQYLIFDHTELSSSTVGAAWEPYTGPNPHTDHVHIELSPRWAADGAGMRARLGLPPRADANDVQPIRSANVSSTRSDEGANIERTREHTGPRPFTAWSRERFELAYTILRNVGLPAAESLRVARALVVLWVTETGWNESDTSGESNFNPGNVTGHSPYGFFRIPGNSRLFRAYANATEGVADAVAVLSTGRYRAAWDRLVVGGDPVEWYDAILRAGYTGWSQGLVDQYASVLRRIPQRLQRG